MIYIASNIRYLRNKCGITQTQLGSCAGGIGYRTIGAYERNLCQPSYGVIIKIAKTLNVTVHELVTEDLKLKG